MRVTALFAFALTVLLFVAAPIVADFVFVILDPLSVTLGGGK